DAARHQDHLCCGARVNEVIGKMTVLHGGVAHLAGATKQAKVVFEFRKNEAANALCYFQDYQEGAGIGRAYVKCMITLVEGT
ncbi:MAG: DUF1330 domain-containing protein, partial [Octadecabacter sp.]|nr:DUF1330 domain-containing protein [Octadecabacter sp.]